MNVTRRKRILAMALVLFAGGSAMASPVQDPEIEAIWKAHVVNFEYRGFSTQYSCRSLEQKLRTVLERMGAREGMELRSYGCQDLANIARFQIAFQAPVAATPENVAAAASFDAHDELLARVRGERLPAEEDIERFPAVWKTVSLARDRKLRLEPGDCEFVEQLRQQILTRMSVRIVTDHVRCSSAFGNIGRPRLTVAALVPATADGAGAGDY